MEVLEVAPGRAKLAMTLTERMVSGHGFGHGGFISHLADSALAFACNSLRLQVRCPAMQRYLSVAGAAWHAIAGGGNRAPPRSSAAVSTMSLCGMRPARLSPSSGAFTDAAPTGCLTPRRKPETRTC